MPLQACTPGESWPYPAEARSWCGPARWSLRGSPGHCTNMKLLISLDNETTSNWLKPKKTLICYTEINRASQVYTIKYHVIHVRKLTPTMPGTKHRATASATRCTGARFSWAVSTRFMIWLNMVWLPSFSWQLVINHACVTNGWSMIWEFANRHCTSDQMVPSRKKVLQSWFEAMWGQWCMVQLKATKLKSDQWVQSIVPGEGLDPDSSRDVALASAVAKKNFPSWALWFCFQKYVRLEKISHFNRNPGFHGWVSATHYRPQPSHEKTQDYHFKSNSRLLGCCRPVHPEVKVTFDCFHFQLLWATSAKWQLSSHYAPWGTWSHRWRHPPSSCAPVATHLKTHRTTHQPKKPNKPSKSVGKYS